ncbi:MAG: response regulator [Planctomycetota bacterium]|nr:MAG: response regulator [Planctomycetota bacterium]
MKRVLSVGNCSFDNGRLQSVLTKHFDVEIDTCDTIDEALEAIGNRSYALVLVNRVLTVGESGHDLIAKLKANPETAEQPVMLLSNYDDAQDRAVELGALRGFGKAELDSEAVRRLLEPLLGA